jgi:hypothetical protein
MATRRESDAKKPASGAKPRESARKPAPKKARESDDAKAKRAGRHAARNQEQVDQGITTARRALELHRDGVHHIDAAAELRCSVSAYYRAVERGRQAAREALTETALDFREWETEGGRRAVARLLKDADTARQDGNIAAAVAAEKAALAARARLSALWGADAPVKVESKVEAGPDLLGALAASLAAQGPALLAMGNGGTMGDDGDG